jgi:hypothetical protein
MSEYQRGYAQGFEDGCNFMLTTESKGSLNNEQSTDRNSLRTEVVREETDKRVVQREKPTDGS